MPDRLPISAARISDVATAALVCEQTVRHYRDGLHLLRATEAAITRAIREMPESPQAELFTDADHVMKRFFPAPVEKPAAVALLAPAEKQTKPPLRPRLRLELPEGCEMPAADGRHWYEEREIA